MAKFHGNIANGTFTSPSQLYKYTIPHFIIVNKTNVTITLNLSIKNGPSYISIAPLNLQLASGQAYVDRNYEIDPGESIALSVSGGNADYYFATDIS